MRSASLQASTAEKRALIWDLSPRVRARRVLQVCEILYRTNGNSRLGNPEDPLDDLVYVMLSNKTAPVVAGRTFSDLKSTFPRWEDVLQSEPGQLEGLLESAGLSGVRSRYINDSLMKLHEDFGRCDLSGLATETDETIQDYLVTLPGVSVKVAKCVMMYTFNRSVLPVDTHVHRICVRLGWTIRKRADQCHEELESLVPPGWRAPFHVACVLHGRTICRPNGPECERCPIMRHCPAGRERTS